ERAPLLIVVSCTPWIRRNVFSSGTLNGYSVGFTSTMPFWKSRRHTLETPDWKCTSSSHTSPASVPRKNESVVWLEVLRTSAAWYSRHVVSTDTYAPPAELSATTCTLRGALALQRNVAE